MKTTRYIITKKVIEILNPGYTNEDIENALKLWWLNRRNQLSLRLSNHGYDVFSSVKFRCWEFEIPKNIPYGLVLKLEKKINSPFYIDKNHIKIYDGRIAMMIILYSNILDYVNKI